MDINEITAKVEAEAAFVSALRMEISKVIVGQKQLIDRLIVALLANGHVLVEGLPGLAKTSTISALANSISASFNRIQFTPDLLPSDVVGTLIYNPKEASFSVKKGPVFANLVLADEINRAPAKVQSALLEAMQERQVTIGNDTYDLPNPLMVLATQNPVEQEGTYPLPEAQVDRFMFKVIVGYPSREEELAIQKRMAKTSANQKINAVITPEAILKVRSVVDEVYIDDQINNYIVDLVMASRTPKDYNLDVDSYIEYGASPRATIALTLAAKAYAFMQKRGYVTPQDVKDIGKDVLRHRILLSYEAEAEDITSDQIVQTIFDTVPVP